MCVTALVAATAIGGLTSLGAGAMQADAANKAAAAQVQGAQEGIVAVNTATDDAKAALSQGTDAAIGTIQSFGDKAIAAQKEGMQAQTDALASIQADMMPWLQAGEQAMFKYYDELGISRPVASSFGADVAMTEAKGFEETDAYKFQVEQGEKGVMNNLAALGLKGSGAAMKALTDFRQGLASQHYDNYLNRLSAEANAGRNTLSELSGHKVNTANALSNGFTNISNILGQTGTNVGNVSATYGTNLASLLQGRGNSIANLKAGKSAAEASGYVGGANAWSNALTNFSNTAGNALGQYAYLDRKYPIAA